MSQSRVARGLAAAFIAVGAVRLSAAAPVEAQCDTLVVETTNFSPRSESPAALYQRTRGSAQQLRLVERFTRVGPDTLQHEFTVEDPGTYAGAWTAMIPLARKDEALFEYACHEGNIGMEGILAGHRAEEREAEAAAAGAR